MIFVRFIEVMLHDKVGATTLFSLTEGQQNMCFQAELNYGIRLQLVDMGIVWVSFKNLMYETAYDNSIQYEVHSWIYQPIPIHVSQEQKQKKCKLM